MPNTWLASLGVFVTAVVVYSFTVPLAGQAQQAAAKKAPDQKTASKGWVVPRTAWGDPDVQGTFTNKNMNGGGDRGRISPEAVQEFQVVTQSYPAEYGGAAGGVTNAVTKSGTNQRSGSVFLFQRHEAFDKPPFNTRARAAGIVEAFPVEEANFFRRQVGGFTLGGPVKRDKAFYFFVLDTTRTHQKRLRTTNQAAIDAVRQLAFPEIPDTPENAASDYKPWEWISSSKVDLNISQKHNVNIIFWQRFIAKLRAGI